MKILACSILLLISSLFVFPEGSFGKERQQLPTTSPPIVTVKPRHTFKDLRANSQTIKQLKNFTSQIARPTALQAVIFVGADHKSKRGAAEAIALQLKRPLLKIDVKRVVGRYIGETEKNINAVFRKAQTQGAILFFEEADALFGKRTDVTDSHDRYANQEVSYLLQHIKRYPGLMIVSTQDTSRIRKLRITKNQSIIAFP